MADCLHFLEEATLALEKVSVHRISERKNRLLEMKVRPAMRAPQYHATLVTLSNPLECKEVSLAVPFVPFDKLGDLPCNRRC